MDWSEWDKLREIRDRLEKGEDLSKTEVEQTLLILIKDAIDRHRD